MVAVGNQLEPHIPNKQKRPLRLLSFPELKSEKGVAFSREHIRRLMKQGKFPKAIKLGDAPNGRVVWAASEIDTWLASRLAQRDAA